VSGSVQALVNAFALELRPRAVQPLWQWANQHRAAFFRSVIDARHLDDSAASGRAAGCDRADSEYESVVLVWASQMGKASAC
jgi:hypothetical protein